MVMVLLKAFSSGILTLLPVVSESLLLTSLGKLWWYYFFFWRGGGGLCVDISMNNDGVLNFDLLEFHLIGTVVLQNMSFFFF